MPSNARPGPGPSSRRTVERVSHPLLLRLSVLPRWLLPVVTFGLALVGLVAGGLIGFSALALIAVFLGWLALLSWPVLTPGHRGVRVLVVAVVAGAAVYQLLA